VRALPGIESAAFDISTEVFTLTTAAGTKPAPILEAIRGLGYEPELLDRPAEPDAGVKRLDHPTSKVLAAALARARQRGVPLVIDFGATWCSLCKKFAATTLTDERVEKALDAFEFLPIDVDEHPAAAKDLGVAGIPDVWFLAGDGRVLGRENRYMPPDVFLAVLERMAQAK